MIFKNLKEIYSCAKQPLDIFTVKLCYPVSIRIVSLLQDTKITPNHLTSISLLLAAVASFFYFFQNSYNLIYGSLFLYISYIFDCADGQLARYKNLKSGIGAWYDQMVDRIKEFLVILSLSWGYYNKTSDYTVLILGISALFIINLLTMEHYAVSYLPQISEEDSLTEIVQKKGESNKAFLLIILIKKLKDISLKMMPLFGFNIGERHFLIIILAALGQIKLLMIIFIVLGTFYAIFNPLRKIIIWRKNIKEGR